jgi:hypothetical protein
VRPEVPEGRSDEDVHAGVPAPRQIPHARGRELALVPLRKSVRSRVVLEPRAVRLGSEARARQACRPARERERALVAHVRTRRAERTADELGRPFVEREGPPEPGRASVRPRNARPDLGRRLDHLSRPGVTMR